MDYSIVDLGTALWLGILTSISPCPLSTNIAAISYVGRSVGKTKGVLYSGILYILGRSLAYLIVGLLVTRGLLSIPGISNFLQRYMNLLVGPLLFIVGIILLEIFKFSLNGITFGKSTQQKLDKMGLWGAGAMGILFALAFCPISAGLFFGGLIPLAIRNNASFVMPVLYGIGTAIPVAVFALLLAFSANHVGNVFNKLSTIEIWARKITAAVMVLIGIYLILRYNISLDLGF